MKITQALWRQHLGRMTKRHWWFASRRLILDGPAEKILTSKGMKIVDAKEVAEIPKTLLPRVDLSHLGPKPLPSDNRHPDWNERPRLKYNTDSVILYGVAQAQVLTNTECINNALPDAFEDLMQEADSNVHQLITRSIYTSHIFDAHQEKLPKKKDPLRPAYNFRRIYGLTDVRKTNNLTQKFLQICELISDPMIGHQRKIVHDGHVRTYIERDSDLLYFESKFDTMVTANKLLTPMINADTEFTSPLPDIYPLSATISLQPDHIYDLQDHYPVASDSRWMNVHTIFVNYDSEKVKNITELPVNEPQILARSLLKSFAAAACCAKQKFGDDVVDMPEPITVQCIQSNSKWFHFSVFQLNTLDLASDKGKRNVWWSIPRVDLYHEAGYIDGRPSLVGYNPEVFNKVLAFYRNV